MYTNDALIDVLNDLVKINNDRIAGYERAIKECKDEDVDLKGLFRNMANESQEYVSELGDLILRSGGRPTDDTTAPGKIYRGWMDLKAAFTGSDRKSLLNSCEFGEDAAQKAYQAALTAEVEMDSESRRLIAEQQSSLKNSHDVIKKYRDLQASIA